jgi:hypothetical protein
MSSPQVQPVWLERRSSLLRRTTLLNDNRPIKRHGSSEYKRHGHVPSDAMDNVKLINAIPTRNVSECNGGQGQPILGIETKKKKTKRKRKWQ